MTDYKLVPIDPTPEMVEAAEDAYMPFGDMELAAKAAGYSLTKGSSGYREFMCKGGVEWNPLTDDGDALRLAMALGIDIVWCSSGRIITTASVGDRVFEVVESSREDREENTRRAITRAAAEMGRLTP